MSDPLRSEDLIEPFRAEFERCLQLMRDVEAKNPRLVVCSDWTLDELADCYEGHKSNDPDHLLPLAAKMLQIAETQGVAEALLWKLSN